MTQPLHPRRAPRPVARFNRRVLGAGLLGVGVIVGGVMLLPRLWSGAVPVQAKEQPQEQLLKLPDVIARELPPRTVAVAAPASVIVQDPPTPPPVARPTPAAPRMADTPSSVLDYVSPFPKPPPSPPGASKTPGGASGTQAGSAAPVGPAKTPKARPKWDMLAKPDAQPSSASASIGTRDGESESPRPVSVQRGPGQQGASTLIQPARWAIPANPLKTIYRSQTLTCRLLQALNSELPGALKMETTTPILDKFGYDTEILPVKTLVIAQQVGQPQYGNKRLHVSLDQLELPSGEVIALNATVGEEDGSNGLTGTVNNHYGKLLLATGISAILNIGVRSAAGTPGSNQFFRTPLQDAAQDVGQGVQQEAQRAVDRELRVPPTIEREALTFCTINLLENIQFNRPPHVAH